MLAMMIPMSVVSLIWAFSNETRSRPFTLIAACVSWMIGILCAYLYRQRISREDSRNFADSAADTFSESVKLPKSRIKFPLCMILGFTAGPLLSYSNLEFLVFPILIPVLITVLSDLWKD